MTASSPSSDHEGDRKVSVALIIGIVLLPYIFAWFLLREGYSQTARIVGFGWTAVAILAAFAGASPPGGSIQSTSGVIIDPDRLAKHGAVLRAKEAVPQAMKDPSSAVFGKVWGMSASVACGQLNGKNSFGAMTGQTFFIFDNGRVDLETSGASFKKRWDALCVDRPSAPAPTGVGSLNWGARPTADLKQFAPATDDRLAIFVPDGESVALEGVAVREMSYSFEHDRLFAGSYYIDGKEGRDAILTALASKYGTPQAYDESKGYYEWRWSEQEVSLRVDYNANHDSTSVVFTKN